MRPGPRAAAAAPRGKAPRAGAASALAVIVKARRRDSMVYGPIDVAHGRSAASSNDYVWRYCELPMPRQETNKLTFKSGTVSAARRGVALLSGSMAPCFSEMSCENSGAGTTRDPSRPQRGGRGNLSAHRPRRHDPGFDLRRSDRALQLQVPLLRLVAAAELLRRNVDRVGAEGAARSEGFHRPLSHRVFRRRAVY